MVCISEKYSGPQYRMTRTATFATNAGLTALPLVHAIIRYGVRAFCLSRRLQ